MKLKIYFFTLFMVVFFVSASFGSIITSISRPVFSGQQVCYCISLNKLTLSDTIENVLYLQRASKPFFTMPISIASKETLLSWSLIDGLTEVSDHRVVSQHDFNIIFSYSTGATTAINSNIINFTSVAAGSVGGTVVNSKDSPTASEPETDGNTGTTHGMQPMAARNNLALVTDIACKGYTIIGNAIISNSSDAFITSWNLATAGSVPTQLTILKWQLIK
jgi:hypothetical protein